MLILQNITYLHSNKEVLFDNISLSVDRHDKIALIGHNGVGKSTMLQLMAGLLQPTKGTVHTVAQPYYVPQIFNEVNNHTVAQALGLDAKLHALHAILGGALSDAHIAALEEDWSIEERCSDALTQWGLHDVDLEQPMASLSGGQKTKVFLAGIGIHKPDIVLMDEPSNHLDGEGRNLLYDFIKTTTSTLVVVSHDRQLLNLLDTVYELSKQGMAMYGGNYDFYVAQKEVESNALVSEVKRVEKALRKAKEVARETMERQQKLDARGKKKQEKAGLPTISMKTFKNNAEKSTARIKDVHAEKIGHMAQELSELRKELPDLDQMKFGFDNSALQKGKVLVSLEKVNYRYTSKLLWQEPLSLEIRSGHRISIRGANGTGKTTLLKIILGQVLPQSGKIQNRIVKSVYIDQEYSLIDDRHNVYEQAQSFNTGGMQEHEIKIRLNRFLFPKGLWERPCRVLSAGEKMRLILCCLTVSHLAPDLIVLDEPTNNLDLQNVRILTAALLGYEGTLIVISHDTYFLKQLNIEEYIDLK